MDTCEFHSATVFHAEANLRALIESTGDPIWSVDLNYGLLTFNQALYDHIEQNFGVRICGGDAAGGLAAARTSALWPPLFQRALSEGPFRAEYSLADGRTLEVAFNESSRMVKRRAFRSSGRTSPSGKRQRLHYGKRGEISEHIRGAIEGIYRATPEGRALTANPAVAQMLGTNRRKSSYLRLPTRLNRCG